MYQEFDILKVAPHRKRIQKLRELIQKKDLDGFLIPRSDLHQNEFIEPCDARLEWLTGFTGSAGLCVVTLKSAFIFVDGRYLIQVRKQTEESLFEIISTSEISFPDWFHSHCKRQIIGYDPWLHTVSEITKLTNKNNAKENITACENLVDLIWKTKPDRVCQSIEAHAKNLSGVSSQIKRKQVSKSFARNTANSVVLTKPESICWLLNIRGKDIKHTPIVQSLALLKKDSQIFLFLREKNLPKHLIEFLGDGVTIFDQSSFLDFLSFLKRETIQIDPNSCPMAVVSALKLNNNIIVEHDDPCLLPKAIKNSTEIRGAKRAHLVDAVAFIKFLHWFDSQIETTKLDEISVIKKLETFRRESKFLRDIAFDTICGFGSNGAIVHYRVNEETNKKIEKNNLLLIDSGGQYQMGTTDLTRTIPIGYPEQKMIDIFTHVLKGVIALSELRWPQGLSGQHIDSLARKSLWSIGLDYDHGTGHGIGSYLSVHEGPQGISKVNGKPLMAGMLVSNEPGYYETEEFGIRIENVLLIKKSPKVKGIGKQMLCFETLTLVPISRKLINPNLLTKEEKDWLNNYHKTVIKKIAPLLPDSTKNWLQKNCAPI